MKFLPLIPRAQHWILLLAIASPLGARTERIFQSSPSLAFETTALVRLLEELHYNRQGVKVQDYTEVIPNYMAELDSQRLFFLAGDQHEFSERFPTQLLYNQLSTLGKLDPAYAIFSSYESRVIQRVSWILDQLETEIDLSTHDTFAVDRSKIPWPATAGEADELWHKRLTFEIIQEVLNKKPVDEAKQAVRKRYERMLKNLDDIEYSDVAEMFLSTITRLYDPHSTYFSAETFEDFSIQLRLQLVGIGALLGVEEDYCVIKEIVTGGPADLSKQLHPNDKIISVAQLDGEPIEIMGMKLRKVVDRIRGQKGSQVKLVIQPADATDPSVRREVVLTRDVVNLNSARARGAIFDVPDAEGKLAPIGVITLPVFYAPDATSDGTQKHSATKDVAELVRQLQEAGIKGLVLDLRQNGGGFLSEAIDLAGLFIKSGPIVQVKNYYGEVKVDSDEDPTISYAGPLAILVSKFSASASEIVAGALQNYGRGIVIGDSSTHGKGSVQAPIEMKSLNTGSHRMGKMGAAKVTIQKFYLPDGHSTQLKGVIPDIVLPSIDDYLPVGETSLPHALVWDEIPSSHFEGKPLDPKLLTTLREASAIRQNRLDEFQYLIKTIDWFKKKQNEKSVSLNLEERQQQKEFDLAKRKEMEAEKARLKTYAYTVREFLLGPAAPKPAAPKKASAEDDAGVLLDPSADDPERLDVHLRESLRILADALDLGEKRELWAQDRPPLTAVVAAKGS